MAYAIIDNSIIQNIANAIRAKLGIQTTMKPDEMPGKIASIPEIQGNAAVTNVLADKTFSSVTAGQGVTGTMPNRGAITKTLAPGETYTVPEGYHNGNGTVTTGGATQEKTATPDVTPVEVTPDEGYSLTKVTVAPIPNQRTVTDETIGVPKTYQAGWYPNQWTVTPEETEPTLQVKTVDPATTDQTVTADSEYDGLREVRVNAIQTETKSVNPAATSQTVIPTDGKYLTEVTVNAASLQSKNVTPSASIQTVTPDNNYIGLSQVNVAAVPAPSLQTKTATPSTSVQIIQADNGYDGLSKVTVGAIQTQTKSATPSTSTQTITPDSGKFLSSVSVGAISTETKTVKSTTTSQTVLPTSGKFISKITVNPISLQSKNISPSTSSQTVTPDSSYDGLSQVTIGAIQTETKTVTPSSSAAVEVTPTSGKYLSKVTVSKYNLGEKTITENGTYNAGDDSLDGYSNIIVNIPSPSPIIIGAEWNGSSRSSWTRTDDYRLLSYIGVEPTYDNKTQPGLSIPFDMIMPWAGMGHFYKTNFGHMVSIPKYYYKWTRDGLSMKLQISEKEFDGSHVSPAHADRGDGHGERDIVYVGMYHCADWGANSYGSWADPPLVNKTRAEFRANIHSLGENVWQWDYAMYWTIAMLYLVEYAHWNSQLMIGYGGSDEGSIQSNGLTRKINYHSGTNAATLQTYGHVRYRWIEDLWGNCHDWVDGIYFNGNNIYCIKNPAQFSDNTNGVLVGTRGTTSGYISSWTNPTVPGFEYALFPLEASGTESTYITDYYYYNQAGTTLCVGSTYDQQQTYGLFSHISQNPSSYSGSYIGSRLMYLP